MINAFDFFMYVWHCNVTIDFQTKVVNKIYKQLHHKKKYKYLYIFHNFHFIIYKCHLTLLLLRVFAIIFMVGFHISFDVFTLLFKFVQDTQDIVNQSDVKIGKLVIALCQNITAFRITNERFMFARFVKLARCSNMTNSIRDTRHISAPLLRFRKRTYFVASVSVKFEIKSRFQQRRFFGCMCCT